MPQEKFTESQAAAFRKAIDTLLQRIVAAWLHANALSELQQSSFGVELSAEKASDEAAPAPAEAGEEAGAGSAQQAATDGHGGQGSSSHSPFESKLDSDGKMRLLKFLRENDQADYKSHTCFRRISAQLAQICSM